MAQSDFSSWLKEMGIQDTFNYVLFRNPLSSTVIDSVKSVASSTASFYRTSPNASPVSNMPNLPKNIENLVVDRVVYCGHPVVRIAGLSGATAVALGAYGSHHLLQKPGLEERKKVYETANRYHFFHTLALFGVPLSRFQKTSGTLISMGMILFCGSCYYDAFTGDPRFRRFAPIGGTLLILGWITLIL